MILSNIGEIAAVKGVPFRVGSRVKAKENTPYAGMQGTITQIRFGDDQETEIEGPEIYCTFDIPASTDFIRELEDRFSTLYGYHNNINELERDFENVIMDADMLDIVPDEAIKQLLPEKVRKGVIFVCSPLRPRWTDPEIAKQEYARNIERATDACRYLSKHGYTPLAPHLYFPQFLNDDIPEEHNLGIRLGLQWLDLADEVWCFGDRVSAGMQTEIDAASEKGIPIFFMTENFGEDFIPYRKALPQIAGAEKERKVMHNMSISDERIDELRAWHDAETSDPDTQEWRDHLTDAEQVLVAKWDREYALGLGKVVKALSAQIHMNKLPEHCFSTLPGSGELIAIKRGESGYYKSDWNTSDPAKNREIADYQNGKCGITKAQEEAMLTGSMAGWDVPGADPDFYEQHKPQQKNFGQTM